MQLYLNHEGLTGGLTPALWDRVPDGILFNPGFGMFRLYDFAVGGTSNAVADWTATATGGSAAVAVTDAAFGHLVLTPGNSADDSAQIQHGHGEWVKLSTSAGYSQFIMEARLKVASVATNKNQFFVGLATTDTTILASGANSVQDHVGLQLIETSAISLATDTTGTSPVTTALTGTVTADTFVTIGFRINVATGVVRTYYNGAPDLISAPTLPTTEMRPSVAVGVGDTNQGVGTVDWVAFAALR